MAEVSRGPPESSGRAQPGRAEQSQLSTEAAPRCPSLCCLRARGIRALTTNSNRFSRAFALNPSSLTPPQNNYINKKHVFSSFSLFCPAKSLPSSFSSSSNPLCLRAPSLLKDQLLKGKKKERKKKKNRCCCWGWFITDRRCLSRR